MMAIGVVLHLSTDMRMPTTAWTAGLDVNADSCDAARYWPEAV